ncbi:4-(cytidine 5'-diphospho)-2-C-methyl-D-erythritol kinase [Jannaschia rubra]|uniref:4-diphosphocytidyl-2-C-methyl-D-erythritol kinase n=1 Tax=Jannaschia rubra TaxID=282197 RepID=A0A0M6XNX5_9RHOB|nr:4-(cytidine 5'-diphospho)-2-C-methyl-D-erythritol kinase [Jannaschia rubra]CTQ32297.1 4-diphosphocytidyl-2-C-methyl-D-erythritol kinase [Jannaschia rubra]SFG47837.1 4-diphosphocytidyl-2-C-methyl-D-erythritol kinase [Jannaschia rubra]
MTRGSTDTAFAPAKVNLTLHVTGRRRDGYHLLDSLVAFADVVDVLTVERGDALTVCGPFADGVPTDDRNLIRRALRLAGTPRAVMLEKNLPHPAGLGGGSSDAAAVLRLVGACPDPAALLSLGADVPVCMTPRAQRMRGIGEILSPVPMPPLHAVLINPGVALPTGRVFAGLATTDNRPMDALPDAGPTLDWLARQRNDLEPPARQIAPVIGDVLSALREAGADIARMSGSGATCFGLWPSRALADKAAHELTLSGWWVRACTLI